MIFLKTNMGIKPDWFTTRMVTLFFVIFYSVGILLFSFGITRFLFSLTVPISLLLVTFLILLFYRGSLVRMVVLSVIIFVSSFFLEYAGIHTGKIFGKYEYLTSLGPELREVPVIIGLNWIMMVLCSAAVMAELSQNLSVRIAGGAVWMVLYDLLLEAVAPVMKMWHFFGEYPPLPNFLAWFGAATVFHTLLYSMKINPENKPARNLFFIQLVFFIFILSIETLRQ